MRLLFKYVQQVVYQVTLYFCKLWCAVSFTIAKKIGWQVQLESKIHSTISDIAPDVERTRETCALIFIGPIITRSACGCCVQVGPHSRSTCMHVFLVLSPSA